MLHRWYGRKVGFAAGFATASFCGAVYHSSRRACATRAAAALCSSNSANSDAAAGGSGSSGVFVKDGIRVGYVKHTTTAKPNQQQSEDSNSSSTSSSYVYFYLGAADASVAAEGKTVRPVAIVDLSPSMTHNGCAPLAKQALVDAAALFQRAAKASATSTGSSNCKAVEAILFSSNAVSVPLQLSEPASWAAALDRGHAKLRGSTAPEAAFDLLIEQLGKSSHADLPPRTIVPLLFTTDGEFNGGSKLGGDYQAIWADIATRLGELAEKRSLLFNIRAIGVIDDDLQHLQWMRSALARFGFSYTTVKNRDETSACFQHTAELALLSAGNQVQLSAPAAKNASNNSGNSKSKKNKNGAKSTAAALRTETLFEGDVVVSAEPLHSVVDRNSSNDDDEHNKGGGGESKTTSTSFSLERAVEAHLRHGMAGSTALSEDVQQHIRAFSNDILAAIVAVRNNNAALRNKMSASSSSSAPSNDSDADKNGGSDDMNTVLARMKTTAADAAKLVEEHQTLVKAISQGAAARLLADATDKADKKKAELLQQQQLQGVPAAAADFRGAISPSQLLDVLEASVMETVVLRTSADAAADEDGLSLKMRTEHALNAQCAGAAATRGSILLMQSAAAPASMSDRMHRLEEVAACAESSAYGDVAKVAKKGFWRKD